MVDDLKLVNFNATNLARALKSGLFPKEINRIIRIIRLEEPANIEDLPDRKIQRVVKDEKSGKSVNVTYKWYKYPRGGYLVTIFDMRQN